MTCARKRKGGPGPFYSTEPEPPANHPQRPPDPGPPPEKQTARLARDRKGRGGKTVTVVSGLVHDPARMQALLADLKKLCGAGGALRAGNLEIQGDQRKKIAAELRRRGYRVKFVGG
ncbi:MAG: translation initiation factor [Chloroflexi bacterium]|nr:translation initiation factor [Chloroflexota bacterium]